MRKTKYPIGTLCAVDSCGRLRRKRDWCDGHYYRFKKRGDLLEHIPLPERKSEYCSVESCEDPLHARTLCASHYNQLMGVTPPKEGSGSIESIQLQCSSPKCMRQVQSVGLCNYHSDLYSRHESNGRFLLDDIEEIRLELESGCWVNKEYPQRTVYNSFRVGTRQRGLHRISYALNNGYDDVDDLPTNLVVMHSCDNPPCFNPDHLSLGSESDNMWDASAKRRLRFGEHNSFSKLTETDVRQLRDSWNNSELSAKELAKKFNIHVVTVYDIVSRKTWDHIE